MSNIKRYMEIKADIEDISSKFKYKEDIKPIFGSIDSLKNWEDGTSEKKFNAAGLSANSNYTDIKAFMYKLIFNESSIKYIVNKILEGADVRSTVLEYVPDTTQRYPEGMSDLPDSEDSDFEPVPVKDVVKSIEADVADGDFYNHINVWKNNKKIADLYNVSELEKFKNDFVHNWRWFDATIDVYLV